MNKFKIPTVLFAGGFLNFFFPLDVDYLTVVGKGIRREEGKNGKPTHEEVDEVHEKYIQEIKRVHEKYKDQGGNVNLVIY